MVRFLFPLALGLAGCLALTSLGLWQLQRLDEKEAYLGEIERMIPAAPVSLPAEITEEGDRFRSVRVRGAFSGDDIPVFLSHDVGPIYRLVAAFETADGRKIMVDRGYVPGQSDIRSEMRTQPLEDVEVVGNLHWPDEVDSWTPEPDTRGVFYGRDVGTLAGVLGTEPVLIIARSVSKNAPPATPLPVTTRGIPNNHLGYAVQWFGLAIVWLGMTVFLLWRTAKRKS